MAKTKTKSRARKTPPLARKVTRPKAALRRSGPQGRSYSKGTVWRFVALRPSDAPIASRLLSRRVSQRLARRPFLGHHHDELLCRSFRFNSRRGPVPRFRRRCDRDGIRDRTHSPNPRRFHDLGNDGVLTARLDARKLAVDL